MRCTLDPVEAALDLERAANHYEQACNLSDPVGCWRLGTFYEAGTSVEQDYVQALASYEVACEAGLEEACAAAEPIAFRARFEQIIQTGFESDICQVWSLDPDDPETNRILAEVRGSQVTLLVSRNKNKTATISHLRSEFTEGARHVASSYWAVDIEGRAWEDEIEHHEVWDSASESVRAHVWTCGEAHSLGHSGTGQRRSGHTWEHAACRNLPSCSRC